jgi:hypothetical protein
VTLVIANACVVAHLKIAGCCSLISASTYAAGFKLLPLLLAVLLLLLPGSAAGPSLGHFLMLRAKSAVTPANHQQHNHEW